MGSSYLVIINEGPLMLWLIIWKDFLIVWLQKQIFSCCSDKWCPFCNLNPGTKKKKKKDRVLISGQKTFFQSHSWSLPLTRNSGNAASRQGSKGLNINHVELFGLSVLLPVKPNRPPAASTTSTSHGTVAHKGFGSSRPFLASGGWHHQHKRMCSLNI